MSFGKIQRIPMSFGMIQRIPMSFGLIQRIPMSFGMIQRIPMSFGMIQRTQLHTYTKASGTSLADERSRGILHRGVVLVSLFTVYLEELLVQVINK